MIDLLALLYQFLKAQPPMQAVGLVSWHLLLVLAVLGLLSGLGLHFLVGHVFRFYRRKERHARWVAWPTLIVFLVTVQVLLGAYLLAVEAPALVRRNLSGEVTARLGRLLLEPAFASPLLGAHPADAVPKAVIKSALHTSAELDYRNRLRENLVAPRDLSRSGPEMAGDAAAAGAPSGPEVLVQIGLRWVTAPHNTWFAPLRAGDQRPIEEQGDEPFFLPDFLASLIDELQEGTVLPRVDWEHVAGTRFVEGILRPLVEEYLTYLALAVALLLLVLDALYFLVMRRLKRVGQPRPAKAPAKKPAPKPTPEKAVKGSAPDTTPTKEAGKEAGAGQAAPPATVPAASGEGDAKLPATTGADSPAPDAPAASDAEGGTAQTAAEPAEPESPEGTSDKPPA